jgi:RNA recognition motif-containing protein
VRAITTSSRSLLSKPYTAKSISSCAAITCRHPLATFAYQRRFNTNDATKAAEESEEQSAAVEETREDSSAEQGAQDAPAAAPAEPGRVVYVGNLFFGVTETDMQNHFGEIGSVKSVKLIQDHRGLSKG